MVGEESSTLEKTLRALKIHYKRQELHLDVKPLLKLIFSRFFKDASGFVEMVVKVITKFHYAFGT